MAQDTWSGRVASMIAEQIRRNRQRQQLSAQDLSARCAQLGLPIHRSVIANLENGRRPTVGIAEVLVLAAALNVPPLRLLIPLDDGDIEMLPGKFTDPWTAVREFTGLGPPEMELLVEHDAEVSNLRSMLRKSTNRGGWIMDVPELRTARNFYRSLVRLRQQMADRGLGQPSLPPELLDQIAQAGFANGDTSATSQQTETAPAEPEPTAAMPPVVAAIVTSDLGVLVGRRNDGKPPWTFIAGEQDTVKDELPQDTATREVKEETGLRVRAGDVIGERVHPQTGRTMIYVAATPTHGTDYFVGDAAELAELRWVSLADADELLPGMFGPVHEYLARELGEA